MTTRRTTILLSLLPGWGHIALGREGQGLIVVTAGAMSGFALLNALFVYVGELRATFIGVAAIATLGVVAYSVADIVRLTSPVRLERVRRLRDQLLWEGMLGSLRGDDLAAEQKYLECARLDPLDQEPVFRAGVAASRRGAWREARRLLLRARRLDTRLKWQWEIEEALARVEAALRAQREAALSSVPVVREHTI